jgi:cytochrome c5
VAGEKAMKKSYAVLIVGILFGAFAFGSQLTGLAQAGTTPIVRAPATKNTPAQSPTEAERGERAWQTNCSRCHYAPETLRPRITGTVIRHMRVRANLSAADEHAILQYLNP